jgi:hypothetical protein
VQVCNMCGWSISFRRRHCSLKNAKLIGVSFPSFVWGSSSFFLFLFVSFCFSLYGGNWEVGSN